MGFKIISGASSRTLTIDSTSKAARATPYDATGAAMLLQDRSAAFTPGTSRILPILGMDYKTPVLLRSASDGSLIAGDRTLLLYDRFEGTTLNTNKWTNTSATMTATQPAASILLFNAVPSIATGVGVQVLSRRFMPVISKASLVFRSRAMHSPHFANNVIELGFGSPGSATTANIGNGACWRKDGTGQYIPVICVNGQEITGTPITNAQYIAQFPMMAPSVATSGAVGTYAVFEVKILNNRAHFSIYKTTGELVFFQVLDMGTTSSGYYQSHLQAMMRMYNIAATTAATQMMVDEVSIWLSEIQTYKPWGEQLAGTDQQLLNNPTSAAIFDAWTNVTAPTVGTPNNTTLGANLPAMIGGQALWNNGGTAFGASDTLDLIVYGVVIPSPYGMMIKGIRLDSISQAATNGAAIYSIEWFLAVNGSAISFATAAPYAYRRKYLGFQTIANGAAAGTQFSPVIDCRFQTGVYVYPGRFFAIGARVIGASAATSAQQIRTVVHVDGYFE